MSRSINPISRRGVLAGIASAGLLPWKGHTADHWRAVTVAYDLNFPEGPIVDTDGSVILSEVLGHCVTRVGSDGSRKQIARIGDGGVPVGLAAGPDGAIYATVPKETRSAAGNSASRGRILRIDPETRCLTDVVTYSEGVPMLIPDDLVFDSAGGFYFTDLSTLDRAAQFIEQTGIYYFDGTSARLVSDRGTPTNGVDLSPDGKRLYWTEYVTGRLFARDIIAPGRLALPTKPYADCLFSHPSPVVLFDSLRVDAEGCVSVAVHSGSLTGKSGIMSFDPRGVPIDFTPMPDPQTTSFALSWSNKKMAHVTCGNKLVSVPWPRFGKRPYFLPSPKFRVG